MLLWTLLLLCGVSGGVWGATIRDVDPGVHEDATLGVVELLTKYGYPGESHSVVTKDGYILGLYRIPYGKKCGPDQPRKPPVLVMHGVLSNSIDWIIGGVDNGLGYILADECFDVWMGNSRGNFESQKHVNLSTEEADFWKFSWHEMGEYDTPAFIDYILEATGQPKLHYIGHSQGSTQFFVYSSLYPAESQQKVIAMQAFAPIAYIENMTSPVLRFLSQRMVGMEVYLDWLGWYQLPESQWVADLGGNLCTEKHPNIKYMCNNLLFILCGYDSAQINETLIQVIAGHDPAGASTRQIIHFGQEIMSGKFRQYDHGEEDNMEKYGAIEPPRYETEKIQVPLYLHYGENDWMAAVQDVQKFADEVPNATMLKVPFPQFSHFDFLWATDVKELLYNRVLEIMNQNSQ